MNSAFKNGFEKAASRLKGLGMGLLGAGGLAGTYGLVNAMSNSPGPEEVKKMQAKWRKKRQKNAPVDAMVGRGRVSQ